MQVTEQQLRQTEEDLKNHITKWTQLRNKMEALLTQPHTDPVKQKEVEDMMKDFEARVVQEGVRAELLEEEFNAISLHLAHLGLLNSEITITSVKVVAHEELQTLKSQVAILKEIQEERKALVQELQSIHQNESQIPGTLVTLELTKDAATSYGFTIVGGGKEQPFVDKIVPDLAAWKAGLRRGDVIVSINGRDVEDGSHEEIVNMIVRSGNSVILTVSRRPESVGPGSVLDIP